MPAYDAVIVGARAAGAATALGLARRGHRVLVLDRDRYGSDTLSTHALQRVAVMLLDDWGVLDAVRAGGTPAVESVTFHYTGRKPHRIALREPLYAPRRTVLDPALVDAAVAAGAEVRYRTRVTGVLRDAQGRVRGVRAVDARGRSLEVEAAITIGADGRSSRIADEVGAPTTHAGRAAGGYVYTQFEGVEQDGYEWLFGEGLSAGLVPTDGGVTTVFVGAHRNRFASLARDRAGAVDTVLERLSPEVAARIRDGRRIGPARGFPGQAARLRRPHGPGWALVGDAGSFKDPISSHGITDALKDSVLLVEALAATAAGRCPWSVAGAAYERRRDDLTMPLLRAVEPVAAYDLPVKQVMHRHLDLSATMKRETDVFRTRLAAAGDSGSRPVHREPVAA